MRVSLPLSGRSATTRHVLNLHSRTPSRPPASVASTVASTGLLETLNREELAGVIAHELAHVKNRDTLTMTVAATIGGAVSMVGQYMQIGAIFGRNDDRGELASMILAQ